MRILVADDDPKVRSALRLLLEEVTTDPAGSRHEECCDVVEADRAEVVVRELGEEAADLLLLDWELPGMAPGEIVDEVRELSPDCVIVALSGCPEAARDAVDRGADAFVSKNEPPDRLVSTLLHRVAV